MQNSDSLEYAGITEKAANFGWGLFAAGAVPGMLISWGILSGDQLGRVNLLYLLLLFVLWPLLMLLATALGLLGGGRQGLTRALTRLPLWPSAWARALKKLVRQGLGQHWLFCQSQLLALGFSLGSLLVFGLLLLGSDINFVWRSTLLDAGQLMPWLEAVAAPWAFWSAAQPSLELLQLTRDSRLLEQHENVQLYGQWWRYLLAAQCVYAIGPRCLLWLAGRFLYRRRCRRLAVAARPPEPLVNQPPPAPSLAEVVDIQPDNEAGARGVLTDSALINWSGLPAGMLGQLELGLGRPARRLKAGPLASDAEEQQALQWPGAKVVVVAAWEPPMGELKDFLETGEGYLLPLDWEGEQWRPVSAVHLDEWRRFCFTLAGWQLIQWKETA